MNRRLAFLSFFLVCWTSASAAGQESDLPRPDESGFAAEERRATLIIEEPAEGDSVEVPFTVSGEAPAGAKLELWLGDTLEGLFQADSAGRFTIAVSRRGTPDARVFIHQVGARGQRIQSASVGVVWGGDAPLVDARDASTPPESEAPPATQEGGGEIAPAASALPRTPDVDLETLEAAPAPPPPELALSGPSPSSSGDDVVLEELEDEEVAAPTTTTFRAQRSAGESRVIRASASALGGLVASLAGGLVGGTAGFVFGNATSNDPFAVLGTTTIGVIAGWALAIPFGVYFTGRMLDGNGKFWATVIGELVGILGGVGIAGLTGNAAPGLGALFVVVLPITGAVMGYELTSDPSRAAAEAESRARTSLRVGPTVLRRPDDSFVTGVGFTIGF